MTVITFAKRKAFSTAFGSKKAFADHRFLARQQKISGSQSLKNRFVGAAALIGAFAILGTIVFGVHANSLMLKMTEREELISSLEKDVEELRTEAFSRSSPRYINERAAVLNLVSGSGVRYVTLGAPGELALENAGTAVKAVK